MKYLSEFLVWCFLALLGIAAAVAFARGQLEGVA